MEIKEIETYSKQELAAFIVSKDVNLKALEVMKMQTDAEIAEGLKQNNEYTQKKVLTLNRRASQIKLLIYDYRIDLNQLRKRFDLLVFGPSHDSKVNAND